MYIMRQLFLVNNIYNKYQNNLDVVQDIQYIKVLSQQFHKIMVHNFITFLLLIILIILLRNGNFVLYTKFLTILKACLFHLLHIFLKMLHMCISL